MPTKIEWTDETWNPVTGCTKISPGCKHCYAERMARRLAGRYGYPEAPHHFDVMLHPERLGKPLCWRKPRQVFVCSMSDLFHADVPFWLVRNVWLTMALAKQHTFQVLTKRPERMLEFVSREWPIHIKLDRVSGKYVPPEMVDILPNVWMGVSVENQDYTFRINYLRQTGAHVKFLSLEPLLGPLPHLDLSGIDWVIAGCESGPGRRPADPDWFRDLRDQCINANVPFFLKQMEVDDKVAHLPALDGQVWSMWPREVCK